MEKIMAKNILVLTGSPRKDGNSDKMADAFIAGARQSGHAVTKYSTADKKIDGCKDCKNCFRDGNACVIHDDFNSLAPLIEQADMVVFATPVYWFSFPAQIKAVIDRFFSFHIGERPINVAQSALLVCAGDTDASVLEGVIGPYRSMASFLKWKDCGIISATGVNNKNDILKTEFLERALALGKSII